MCVCVCICRWLGLPSSFHCLFQTSLSCHRRPKLVLFLTPSYRVFINFLVLFFCMLPSLFNQYSSPPHTCFFITFLLLHYHLTAGLKWHSLPILSFNSLFDVCQMTWPLCKFDLYVDIWCLFFTVSSLLMILSWPLCFFLSEILCTSSSEVFICTLYVTKPA